MDRTTARTRIVLMPDDRTGSSSPYADKIRRYRLARVRLIERREAVAARYPHLTRVYD